MQVSAEDCSAEELASSEKAVLLEEGSGGPPVPARLSEGEYLASLPNPNEGGASRGLPDSPLEERIPFTEVPFTEASCTAEKPRVVVADRADTNGAVRSLSEGSGTCDPDGGADF